MSCEPCLAPATYIDTERDLARLVRAVRKARRVAVDTEADSLHSYREKVCLIQISLLGTGHYIVDPLAPIPVRDLMAALRPKKLLFHGADYDLRLLRAGLGFEPEVEVFDTMLAAQLLGYEHIGLAALVERFFDFEMSKRGQRSDWSRRPLTREQIEYAANDTRYLEPLVCRLEDELARLGRGVWHRQACAAMVESSRQDTVRDPDEVWRIKGTTKLTGRGPALLRELWRWREKEAERSDRPPFKVLNNPMLLALAEWAAENPHGSVVEDGPRLPRNFRGRRLARLEKALGRGWALPKTDWPSARRPRDRDRRANAGNGSRRRVNEDLMKRIQRERDTIAENLEISPSVLAPRAALIAMILERPADVDALQHQAQLLPWQAELLAPKVLPLLSGEAS